MFNLSSYLEKFKNLKDPKEDKIIAAGIISDISGILVSEQDISIQKNTIYVKSSALSKNHIFMRREEIIRKIEETLPNLYIKEII